MDKHEWARLLDSLRGDDAARRNALLMLSDEDWVADGERAWLREASLRPDVLNPLVLFDRHRDVYWSCQKDCREESEAQIPDRLIRALGAVGHNDRPSGTGKFTRYYPSAEKAWLDLLRVISRGGSET